MLMQPGPVAASGLAALVGWMFKKTMGRALKISAPALRAAG